MLEFCSQLINNRIYMYIDIMIIMYESKSIYIIFISFIFVDLEEILLYKVSILLFFIKIDYYDWFG